VDSSSAPHLNVEQVAPAADTSGGWWVTWRIRNVGEQPLELVDVYVPHGKFYGPRVDLSSSDPVDPGTTREIQLEVVFKEPLGAVVENAFLILTATQQKISWRILIRMTVESGSLGAPMAKTELITTQKVGFSADG